MKNKKTEIIVLETTQKKEYVKYYPNSISLKQMQDIVGGSIELLYVHDDIFMVLNEEGLIRNFKVNQLANQYLKKNMPKMAHLYQIVGDVFLIQNKFLN